MNGLTGKQKAFIDEYFVDFNATRAAQRAGYGGNENTLANIGSTNLIKPKIARHIAERFQAQCMTADECLARLGKQARADLGDYIDIAGYVDLERLKQDGLTDLIKKYKVTRTQLRGIRVEIEIHDQQRALELIGKAHGLFRERHEHTGKDGGPIKSDIEHRAAVTIYIPDNGRDRNQTTTGETRDVPE